MNYRRAAYYLAWATGALMAAMYCVGREAYVTAAVLVVGYFFYAIRMGRKEA